MFENMTSFLIRALAARCRGDEEVTEHVGLRTGCQPAYLQSADTRERQAEAERSAWKVERRSELRYVETEQTSALAVRFGGQAGSEGSYQTLNLCVSPPLGHSPSSFLPSFCFLK